MAKRGVILEDWADSDLAELALSLTDLLALRAHVEVLVRRTAGSESQRHEMMAWVAASGAQLLAFSLLVQGELGIRERGEQLCLGLAT